MADVIRTRTQLLSDFATTGTGVIQAQQSRNFIVSVFGCLPHATKSTAGPYTATVDDGVLIISYDGNYTVDLPAASTMAGRFLLIKKTSAANRTVTIDPNASETIDGALTQTLLAQNSSMMLFCDGSNWFIL